MFPAALSVLIACLPLPATSAPTAPRPDDLRWFEGSLTEALGVAREQERLVVLNFGADWSDWCKQHQAENLHDPEIVELLSEFLCLDFDLSMDDEGNIIDKQAEALMRRFAVRRFPSMLCLRPDGTPEDLISGYLPVPALLMELERILAGDKTVSHYERLVGLEPAELEWRYQLALKLDDVGDAAGYQRELDAILAADPEGVSLPRRRMALGQLREHLWGCMRDPEIEPDPAELARFLAQGRYDEVLCDGWLLMAAVQSELGQAGAARDAYRTAWKHVASAQRASVGNGIAWKFWTERTELSPEEKQWALAVAQESTSAFEQASCDPLALAQYYDTLACCRYMVGEREEALRLIERCMELDPDTAEFKERYEFFDSRG